MIFVARGAFCQITSQKTLFFDHSHSLKPTSKNNYQAYGNIYRMTSKIPARAEIYLRPTFFSLITPDHYTQNFGFFCKKELQFEKITKVPFKFRLGGVQYCDWMEGKRNTGVLPNN